MGYWARWTLGRLQVLMLGPRVHDGRGIVRGYRSLGFGAAGVYVDMEVRRDDLS